MPRRWLLCLLLVPAALSPAWANYSWGQFTLFRPGVQLGIVLITLASETAIVAWLAALPWARAAVAVLAANLLSGFAGVIFLQPNLLQVQFLPISIILSFLIEAIVVIPMAGGYGRMKWGLWRPAHAPVSFPWLGLIMANIVSALLALGYLSALYHGREMPVIPGASPLHMRTVARRVQDVAAQPGRNLRAACEGRTGLGPMLMSEVALRPAWRDVAPAWAPWSELRYCAAYESGAIPETLDPPGAGRPLIWTGAPYVHGRRAVIFTDGSLRSMTEREFRRLGATPSPPPLWLTEAAAAAARSDRRNSDAGPATHH